MKKMDGRSLDILEENIEKMKQLFPEVFTEKKIDFEKLQEVLGDYTEDEDERYDFTWNGKKEAIRIAQTPTTGTLRPDKENSKDWDNTENLYIEGDNLEVLKLLQKSYHSKIKMIYIDPPYNTGKDFVYRDNYRDNMKNYLEYTGQVDDEGKKMSTNSESSGRYHTDWLNMMYPRLRLARNLLRDDGVIFISIDDNEVHNLRKICDEIFGEDNFVSSISWQARQSIQNDTDLSSSHEDIVVYAKKRRKTHRRLKEINKKEWYSMNSFACYPVALNKEKFDNPDGDSRGPWKGDPFDAPNIRPNLTYIIKNPNTEEEFLPPKGRCWRTEEDKFKELLNNERIIFGKTGESRPQLKVFYSEKKEFGSVENTWFDGKHSGTATEGTKLLMELFDGNGIFDTPKPVRLIKRLLNLATGIGGSGIILDFFAGSSTTAHSIMDLNLEDEGNRKYIMVQLPEETDEKSEAFKSGYETISEIGRERIRRAGEKIKEDNKDKEGIEDLDIGFKAFKLDSSNIKEWNPEYDDKDFDFESLVNNFVDGRSEEDILYEIILKYGIDLTTPIEEHPIEGKTIYDIGFGTLYICLDNNIDEKVIEKIVSLNNDSGMERARVVFKDTGFKNDEIKLNAKLTLENNGIEEVLSI